MTETITFTEKEWIAVQEVLLNVFGDDSENLTKKQRLALLKKIKER